VIGAGYLGKFHAEKYSKLPTVNLVGVIDLDKDRATAIAELHHTQAFTQYQDILTKVDAVSIAVPTDQHYAVAKECLEAGLDVLIEKPITHKIWEAQSLLRLAKEKDRIIQVGHLERFNPAIQKLTTILTRPLFIECHRLHSFVQRGTEVDVILDLMIHDLDIILSLVRSPVSKIHAIGVTVLSNHLDIANVRLEFESGCVANITASRVSLKAIRKIRLFQPDCYAAVDFHKSAIEIYKKTVSQGEQPEISGDMIEFDKKDVLEEEIKAFVNAIQTRTPPLVSGKEALEALKLAHDILGTIRKSAHQQYPDLVTQISDFRLL